MIPSLLAGIAVTAAAVIFAKSPGRGEAAEAAPAAIRARPAAAS